MANINLPDALKQIKPYLTLATQVEQRNEKAIAYFCRMYAVQNGIGASKSSPEAKKALLALMDMLEATKGQLKGDQVITDPMVGQAHVENYAVKIFEKADEDDRAARFTKNLVKQFYTAGLLFDILTQFGELSEDLVVKKQYAKRKAMYLNRCFQTGQTPEAGPLIDEQAGDFNEENFGAVGGGGAGAAGFNNSPAQNYPPASTSPSKPSNFTDPYINRPTPPAAYKPEPEKTNKNYYEETNISSEASFPVELIQKAQKLCKFANSALDYEDIPTAITNLEQCLKLLKTGKIN